MKLLLIYATVREKGIGLVISGITVHERIS